MLSDEWNHGMLILVAWIVWLVQCQFVIFEMSSTSSHQVWKKKKTSCFKLSIAFYKRFLMIRKCQNYSVSSFVLTKWDYLTLTFML